MAAQAEAWQRLGRKGGISCPERIHSCGISPWNLSFGLVSTVRMIPPVSIDVPSHPFSYFVPIVLSSVSVLYKYLACIRVQIASGGIAGSAGSQLDS